MKLWRWLERQFNYQAHQAHVEARRIREREQNRRLNIDQLDEQIRLLRDENKAGDRDIWRLNLALKIYWPLLIVAVLIPNKTVSRVGLVAVGLLLLLALLFIAIPRWQRGKRHEAAMKAVENWPKEELVDHGRADRL